MFVGRRRRGRASVRSTQTRPGRFTHAYVTSSEVVNQDRRQLLSAAAMGIAAAGAAGLFPAYPAPAATSATSDEIRPFRITVPEEALVDLRRRINATRWPDMETVADDSQGVSLAVIWEVARYWGTDYEWRRCEAKLNALPQFMTEIDGLDIHFIHVRSKHENALPLIVTHGWPGSVIEQLKIIDPLTNPTAHGASASDAFHLVIPSIPGYGFSARPTTTGWGPDRTARAWVVLMKAPRIRTTRGARRRFGRGCLGGDGSPGASGITGHSRQPAWDNSTRDREGAPVWRSTAARSFGRRTTRLRAAPGVICEATRLRPDDGNTSANAVRVGGLTGWPRSLASRPRRRLWPAGGGDHLCRSGARSMDVLQTALHATTSSTTSPSTG